MNSPILLSSTRLRLRPTLPSDAAQLLRILLELEVAQFWPDYDLSRVEQELIAQRPNLTVLAIEHADALIGAIQFAENPASQYRHASIDLFLSGKWHGQGLGREAIRTVVDYLFAVRGHHRITIDPAAHNQRAIRAYAAVGFRKVGILQRYERGRDGRFHDGILMELIAQPSEAMRAVPRHIDLSHTIAQGLVTYPGIPAPIICDYMSRAASRERYAPGTEFHIGKIEMVANTGTYVDSPFHRYANGKDLADLELARLADVEAVVVRARQRQSSAIDVDSFAALGNLRGKAVLIDTGWDAHFGTDRYFEGHPFLTEQAARWLVQAAPAIVGIDSLNIDDTADPRRPVHTHLLGADIPIVEHLTQLQQVPDARARFFATPVKVRDFGTFPVRAFVLTAE